MQQFRSTTDELMIRPEKAKDLQGVRSLLIAAFNEREDAELVERLRGSKHCYVDGLTLVAEVRGEVRGFAMVSRASLQFGENMTDILVLGPVAVLPAHQRTGIGSGLIREAIRLADERGEKMIVVLGHEAYYPRFGFMPASRFGIKPPQPWPDANYMVRPLSAHSEPMQGTVVYPPEWNL
jgi:predicted N-acetyltransferase YhbS